MNKPAMIFILATGRSGTHAVRSVLAQESWIQNFNEVFNPDQQRTIEGDFTRFIDRMIRISPDWVMNAANADTFLHQYFEYLKRLADERVPLVDIKDEQLRIMDWPVTRVSEPPRLLRQIIASGEPIIRMTRRNWLAQYISLRLALETKLWASYEKRQNESVPKFRLDKGELLGALRAYEASETLMQGWLASHPHTVFLSYEELFRQGSLSESCRMAIEKVLGASLTPAVSPLTHKLAPPPTDLIANVDEVRGWLADTDYAHLL